MTFEITLDMEALGEDDTILVKDEFGEYPDCEYVPKSIHDQLKAENEKLRELLQRSITTHDRMCTQRKNCFGCRFSGDFVCEPIKVSQEAEKLGIEVK